MKLSISIVKSPRFLKEKLSQKKVDQTPLDHEQLTTDNHTEMTNEPPAEEQVVTSQLQYVTPVASLFG